MVKEWMCCVHFTKFEGCKKYRAWEWDWDWNIECCIAGIIDEKFILLNILYKVVMWDVIQFIFEWHFDVKVQNNVTFVFNFILYFVYCVCTYILACVCV